MDLVRRPRAVDNRDLLAVGPHCRNRGVVPLGDADQIATVLLEPLTSGAAAEALHSNVDGHGQEDGEIRPKGKAVDLAEPLQIALEGLVRQAREVVAVGDHGHPGGERRDDFRSQVIHPIRRKRQRFGLRPAQLDMPAQVLSHDNPDRPTRRLAGRHRRNPRPLQPLQQHLRLRRGAGAVDPLDDYQDPRMWVRRVARAHRSAPRRIRRMSGIGGEPWAMTASRCSL